jgi:hypothetical protein
MDPISLSAIALTFSASGLSAIAKAIWQRRQKKAESTFDFERFRTSNTAQQSVELQLSPPRRARLPAGITVLLSFALIIIIFGGFSLYYYWSLIAANGETLIFALWLFFAMVAGMFVQVLAANFRAGRPLFDISASQLVFPLLFALIVYYPIWALAASSPRNLFPFYAAFLNGYFWESVVSAAKAPAPNASHSET